MKSERLEVFTLHRFIVLQKANATGLFEIGAAHKFSADCLKVGLSSEGDDHN